MSDLKRKRRNAEYLATLVYSDGPHLIALKAAKLHVLALAIPDDDKNQNEFFATTVHKDDWDKYFSGIVDLRYLFVYPGKRQLFQFNLFKLINKKVTMNPYASEVPESWLPEPKFFASNHTTDFERPVESQDTECLFVDGEWELSDFGRFQQKYTDVYAFISTLKDWASQLTDPIKKKSIKAAFLHRPFHGGGSYLHFFQDLHRSLSRVDRPGLDKIRYASPGVVEISGRSDVFDDICHLIPTFLERAAEIGVSHNKLRHFLQKQNLLTASASSFKKNDPYRTAILDMSKELSDLMTDVSFDAILELSDDNALVTSKIVLAVFRRCADTATYFAQGRVSFEN